MTRQPVTDSLLHDLVAGSHAEGTTRLAVAVRVENNHQMLLVDTTSDTADPDISEPRWELPTDLVLPGETLTDAVCRTAATVGISIEALTGYVGHHDLPTDDTVIRTFIFTATTRTSHPAHVALGAHRWAELDELPACLTRARDFLHPR